MHWEQGGKRQMHWGQGGSTLLAALLSSCLEASLAEAVPAGRCDRLEVEVEADAAAELLPQLLQWSAEL